MIANKTSIQFTNDKINSLTKKKGSYFKDSLIHSIFLSTFLFYVYLSGNKDDKTEVWQSTRNYFRSQETFRTWVLLSTLVGQFSCRLFFKFNNLNLLFYLNLLNCWLNENIAFFYNIYCLNLWFYCLQTL